VPTTAVATGTGSSCAEATTSAIPCAAATIFAPRVGGTGARIQATTAVPAT
jgi:hypothetical protein